MAGTPITADELAKRPGVKQEAVDSLRAIEKAIQHPMDSGAITNDNAGKNRVLPPITEANLSDCEEVLENYIGSVGLKVHVNMGSFCNFDIAVEGVTDDHAIALIEQASDKFIPVVGNIIKEAMKASAKLGTRFN